MRNVKSAICNVDADTFKINTQHRAAFPYMHAANRRWPSREIYAYCLSGISWKLVRLHETLLQSSVHIYRPTMYEINHLAIHSS